MNIKYEVSTKVLRDAGLLSQEHFSKIPFPTDALVKAIAEIIERPELLLEIGELCKQGRLLNGKRGILMFALQRTGKIPDDMIEDCADTIDFYVKALHIDIMCGRSSVEAADKYYPMAKTFNAIGFTGTIDKIGDSRAIKRRYGVRPDQK